MYRILTLAAVLLLSACSTAPKLIPAPKVVYVTVEKTVGVPAKLTAKPPIPMPKENSVEEAVRMAKERKTALEMCYADKDSIRKLPLEESKNGN